MVKWLSGLKEEKSGNASPVLRLLCSLLARDGDLCEEGKVRYSSFLLEEEELHNKQAF